MRDKRPVDELSIEELERILAIRKRELRQKQLQRLSQEGRRVLPNHVPQESTAPPPQEPAPVVPAAPEARPPAAPMSPSPDGGIPHFEDDIPVQEIGGESSEAQERFRKMVWNRSLLVVELLALIGLVIIGAQMFQALQTLQEETAAVQAEAQAIAFASIPTPTVTPEIRLDRVVLPGGHTPPTSPGGAQFNLNEIPEHLRPVVQQQLNAAPIALPTPSTESPVRIQIPRIGVDAPVVSGTDWEALKRGVGHQPGTGMPGEPGNVVLSAHNDIYGEIFRYLDQLEPGDEIIIHTLSRQYTYVVRETQIVSPYAVQVMDATRDPMATLISCYPYQVDNQRIVVFAELQNS